MSHQMMSQVGHTRNTNSASRLKAVHMRTSQDYQEQSQASIHQQSNSMPFTSYQQKADNKGVMFKSMDSNISHQGPTIAQKFTPKDGVDAESLVDAWLAHLKFHPFMSAEFEFVNLTEDPRRNGIFIAELVAYLIPQSAQARSLSEGSLIKQRPKSVVDCQKNWASIFSVLYQLFSQMQSNSSYANARFLSKQMMQALM